MKKKKVKIDTLSTEELEIEVKRRKILEAQKEAKDLRKTQLLKSLTRGMVDLLHPNHGRTNCSDKNRINGWNDKTSTQWPRCSRCALLNIVHDKILPDEFEVKIEILKWS